ncbi:factor H binding protein domain-containing protein [Neisseria lactamica]|uniref:factor H binding protein domain-containing protein n=1 Tax=Neisseria lactamica TaxID=486 RepID=UPI0027E17E71|nr:factor H binding protein domain-containing protein [Neisseria lactamica]
MNSRLSPSLNRIIDSINNLIVRKKVDMGTMGSGLQNHKLIYLISEILGIYDDFEQSFRIERDCFRFGGVQQHRFRFYCRQLFRFRSGRATQGAVVNSFYGVKDDVKKAVDSWAVNKGFKPTEVELASVTQQVGSVSSNGSNINLFDVVPARNEVQTVGTVTTARVKAGGDNYELISKGRAHIYRQNYSLVAGLSERERIEKDPTGIERNLDVDDDVDLVVKGSATKALPTKGSFDYTGAAGNGKNTGVLSYNVNFENKTGSGKITGLGKTLNLAEGKIASYEHHNSLDNTTIRGHGISGQTSREDASASGSYKLGFFGPNAEEIVGAVNDGEIGFAGSR